MQIDMLYGHEQAMANLSLWAVIISLLSAMVLAFFLWDLFKRTELPRLAYGEWLLSTRAMRGLWLLLMLAAFAFGGFEIAQVGNSQSSVNQSLVQEGHAERWQHDSRVWALASLVRRQERSSVYLDAQLAQQQDQSTVALRLPSWLLLVLMGYWWLVMRKPKISTL